MDKEKKGIALSNNEEEYKNNYSDQLLICAKQRHGEWEGKIPLYFHNDSLQFIAEDRNQPMPFNIEPTTQPQMEV